MKQAARVFIWIGMISQGPLGFPIVVGILALKAIARARTRAELKTRGILTLIFCSILGGIFMLCIRENELGGSLSGSAQSITGDTIHKKIEHKETVTEYRVLKKTAHTWAIVLGVFCFLISVLLFVYSLLMVTSGCYAHVRFYDSMDKYYRGDWAWFSHPAGGLAIVLLVFASIFMAYSIAMIALVAANKTKTFKGVIISSSAMVILMLLGMIFAIVLSIEPELPEKYLSMYKYKYYDVDYYDGYYAMSMIWMLVTLIGICAVIIALYIKNRTFNAVSVTKTHIETVETSRLEEELNKLSAMHDSGAITDSEYAELRSGVIRRYSNQ